MKCKNIIYDSVRGEVICADTGEVLEDHVVDYEHPPWRAYDIEEKVRREHAAPLKVKRRGVEKAIEALISRGIAALKQHHELGVSERTIKSIYNKLVSTTPIEVSFRESQLKSWIDILVYKCLIACTGYPEESVFNAVAHSKGRLAPIAKDLKEAILNSKIQAIIKLHRKITPPKCNGIIHVRGDEVKTTIQGIEEFDKCINVLERYGELKCVNIFLKLPKYMKISLPLAAKVFGVGLRHDGRIIASLDTCKVHIHPNAINIYGKGLKPMVHLMKVLPKTFSVVLIRIEGI